MSRNVIVYIAASADGFIAGPGDDLSFLAKVEKEGEDYGYADFITTVDTVVLGKRTYDKVLSMGYPFPHADKEAYIITRTEKQQVGRTIFIDGGAYIVNRLLKAGLIDEMYLSLIPVLLGSGTALFQQDNPLQQLTLVGTRTFDTGLVQLHYRLQNS